MNNHTTYVGFFFDVNNFVGLLSHEDNFSSKGSVSAAFITNVIFINLRFE